MSIPYLKRFLLLIAAAMMSPFKSFAFNVNVSSPICIRKSNPRTLNPIHHSDRFLSIPFSNAFARALIAFRDDCNVESTGPIYMFQMTTRLSLMPSFAFTSKTLRNFSIRTDTFSKNNITVVGTPSIISSIPLTLQDILDASSGGRTRGSVRNDCRQSPKSNDISDFEDVLVVLLTPAKIDME